MTQLKLNNIAITFLTIICLIVSVPAVNAQIKETHSADNNLQMLFDGNTRFVSGDLSKKDIVNERAELIKGQHPYAIIVSCSDSRVPPEMIFDESLGKLFIIRVAGNVLDSISLGSIEYAVEHLHVKLLVIMGHESCGAVKAAIEGGEFTPNINQIVRRIEPAIKKASEQKIEENSLTDYVIEENVKNQISSCLHNSHILKELYEKKELQIAGAIYNLKTDIVTLVPEELAHH